MATPNGVETNGESTITVAGITRYAGKDSATVTLRRVLMSLRLAMRRKIMVVALCLELTFENSQMYLFESRCSAYFPGRQLLWDPS